MPIKDVRTQFTSSAGNAVLPGVKFTHKVARGTLVGSGKTWIRKEMKDPAVAKIEMMAQEFFRLIIPHQPETRLLHNPVTGTHYILSEEVPGYRELPQEPHNFTSGRYTGLGQVLVGSVFLQEIDLKNGNLGLDVHGRVIKIDGDWCFAQGRYGHVGHLYDITPETIASLPYPNGFFAYTWLDLVVSEVKYASSLLVEPALSKVPTFREEVNQAILKICLMPNEFIERYVDANMSAGGERFVDLMKVRREQLLTSAMKNPSFRAYLKTPKAEEDARNLIAQMNSFVINDQTKVVPDVEHKLMETKIMAQLHTLHSVVVREEVAIRMKEEEALQRKEEAEIKREERKEREERYERHAVLLENHALLDKIYENRVSDKDKLVVNYVSHMRAKFGLSNSMDELLECQRELEQTLSSVSSAEVKATKKAAQDFMANAHWWTVGKEKKAIRITNALINTPIDKRINVITARGAANKVQEALASHRQWGYGGVVYKTDKGQINFEKAAKTFKKLNTRFFKDKHTDEVEPDEKTGPKP